MRNYVDAIYNEKEKPVTAYPKQLIRYLIERFQIMDGSCILDNGCGRGDFLKAFSESAVGGGYRVYGTDIDGTGNCIRKVDLEYEKLPFEDNFFDIVFSKSVMEHLYRADHYLNEMHRVLKCGGRLILMVPDWKTQCRIFFNDPTHVHPYTKASVEKLLIMQGYAHIFVEYFHQLPVLWKHPELTVFVKLLGLMGPVKKIHRNKFVRFSRELMILGTGIKQKQ